MNVLPQVLAIRDEHAEPGVPLRTIEHASG
jgi:hypothetical protein